MNIDAWLGQPVRMADAIAIALTVSFIMVSLVSWGLFSDIKSMIKEATERLERKWSQKQ